MLLLALILSMPAYGGFPFEPKIKAGKFRFENFQRIKKTRNNEYVALMCLNHKPNGWQEPMQFKAGKQSIWVHASTFQEEIKNSELEAFLHFDVTLEAGKSYMFNRKAEGDRMTIWIQEVKTGIGMTDRVTVVLKRPVLNEHNLRNLQCAAGTI